MRRRDLLRRAAAAAAGACFSHGAGRAGAETPRPAPNHPNVLLVILDDMNDWASPLGGYRGKVHTPNLQRLARRGVTFTNAHTAAPVCNPSRTAVLTGLRPSTTGIYHNGHWWRPHLPDVVSLPAWFKTHGYHVAGGGKVFHHTVGFNPPDSWSEWHPWVQDEHWNFTYPVPGEHQSRKGIHWPKGFPLNGIENVRTGKRPPMNWREFDWGPLDKDDLDTGDGQLVRWAVEKLKKPAPGGRPLFLAAGIFRPHLCWYAPRKYFDMYPLDKIRLPERKADDLADVPPAGRKIAAARTMDFRLVQTEGQYKRAVQAYLACISFADAMLGRLLDALEAGPFVDNTVVVVWSDHGWHLGEKDHWHKMTLWERSTRVPLLWAGPGAAEGARCSRPVGLIDLYPTLLDLCGLPANKRLDGTSLRPLLTNPQAPWARPALTTYRRGNHAVRDERYRYIRYADGGEELYDHKTDPHEWTNLAGQATCADVKARLARYLPKTDAANAPSKGAYVFDTKTYTWKPKARKAKPPKRGRG